MPRAFSPVYEIFSPLAQIVRAQAAIKKIANGPALRQPDRAVQANHLAVQHVLLYERKIEQLSATFDSDEKSGIAPDTQNRDSIVGFFSFFQSKDPTKVAEELVAAALSLDLSSEEEQWIDSVGVARHRYISERNVLRMGMTGAGVGLALGTHRHVGSPGFKLAEALREQFENYFSAMPNATPNQGRWFYVRSRDRYILREPAEMAGIFHHYLLNPGAWEDMDAGSTPRSELPEGFQSFVHKLMKRPLENALVRAKELGE